MSQEIKQNLDLRTAMERKTVRHVETTSHYTDGFAAVRITMADGTVVYFSCKEQGSTPLNVEKLR